MLEAAVWLVMTYKYKIIPCKIAYLSDGGVKKPPIWRDWQKRATNDPQEVAKIWKENPYALIGVPCGEDNKIVAVDVDARNGGFATVGELSAQGLNFSDTEQHKAPGGWHRIYQYSPEVPNSLNFKDYAHVTPTGKKVAIKGIDLISNGKYVIWAPGVIPDYPDPVSKERGRGTYSFQNDLPPAELDPWLIEMAKQSKAPRERKAKDKVAQDPEVGRRAAEKILEKVLETFRTMESSRNDTINKQAYMLGGLVTSGFLDESETLRRCAEALRENGTNMPSSYIDFHLPRSLGQGKGRPMTPFSGENKPTLDDLLSGTRLLGVVCRYNVFNAKFEVDITCLDTGELGKFDTDVDLRVKINLIRLALQREYGWNKVTKDEVEVVIDNECVANSYHSVLSYWDPLKWDGTPRAERWLVDYCGAEDNEYTRAVGLKWLMAIARRVKHPDSPDSKFDEMLVLEGEQGIGKSTALSIIIGRRWFVENFHLEHATERPKYVLEQTRGKMVVEVSELTGIRGAKVEALKSLLSTQTDSSRLSYDKDQTERDRMFVFAGTTNDDNYLSDQTGNRRYWPVKVGKFNLEKLKQDRDQIWAEVCHLEQQRDTQGRPASIRLPEHLWSWAAREQSERVTVSVAESYLAQLNFFHEGKIRLFHLHQALTHAGYRASNSDAMDKDIAKAMKNMGWGKSIKMKWPGLDGPDRGYVKGVKLRADGRRDTASLPNIIFSMMHSADEGHGGFVPSLGQEPDVFKRGEDEELPLKH